MRSFSVGDAGERLALAPHRDGLVRGGTRALVYSHVAIEMLRRQLFHQLGEELARAILAQAARQAGFSDAQLMLQEQAFTRIEAMFEAQFRLLAESGFGRFELLDLALNVGAREAYVRTRCFGSPEADSHRRQFGESTRPACCHLVGYMTGWSSSTTGLQLLTVESRCVAKGDPHCEFETLPYADFVGPEAGFWKSAFETTSASLVQELKKQLATTQEQVATIAKQREDIERLSSPILQISDDVLVLPIIGAIDEARSAAIAETLLQAIVRHRASSVIVDLTGIASIDSTTVDHFIRMIGAVRLLGARAVVTGISASMSQLLTAEGTALAAVTTRRTLQEGIRHLSATQR